MTSLPEEVTVYPAYVVRDEDVVTMFTNTRGGLMWQTTTPLALFGSPDAARSTLDAMGYTEVSDPD